MLFQALKTVIGINNLVIGLALTLVFQVYVIFHVSG